MSNWLHNLIRPKRADGNFMKDYLEAEYAGQADSSSCSSLYKTCPVSLFNFLRPYSTPADKPVYSDQHQQQQHTPPIDEHHSPNKEGDLTTADDGHLSNHLDESSIHRQENQNSHNHLHY